MSRNMNTTNMLQRNMLLYMYYMNMLRDHATRIRTHSVPMPAGIMVLCSNANGLGSWRK
jgi:hypothetical protein